MFVDKKTPKSIFFKLKYVNLNIVEIPVRDWEKNNVQYVTVTDTVTCTGTGTVHWFWMKEESFSVYTLIKKNSTK